MKLPAFLFTNASWHKWTRFPFSAIHSAISAILSSRNNLELLVALIICAIMAYYLTSAGLSRLRAKAKPELTVADFVYSREETSPNGALKVCYGYSDGEKAPLMIEPRVTATSTNRIIIDLWRTGLNGHIDAFTDSGFRLTVSDVYGPATIITLIDVAEKSFVLEESDGPSRTLRSLSLLVPTLRAGLKAARTLPNSCGGRSSA